MKQHQWYSFTSHMSPIGIVYHYRCIGCKALVTSPRENVDGQIAAGPNPIDLEDDGVDEDCDLEIIKQVMES